MARHTRGFTLIELLIVVVIIGLLAGIALIKGGAIKDKAKVASLKADIHNAEVAQEAYYSDLKKYANLNQLKNSMRWTPSTGNVMTVSANAAGYNLTIKNSSITKGIKTCKVKVGQNAAPSVDGVIICS